MYWHCIKPLYNINNCLNVLFLKGYDLKVTYTGLNKPYKIILQLCLEFSSKGKPIIFPQRQEAESLLFKVKVERIIK